jgi:hypothetical protein
VIDASCHCGEVEIRIANKPNYTNLCDCSLCAKSGGAWGYYESGAVSVTGETKAYRRADYDEPAVEMRFCPNCGTTTHWTLTENCEGDRVGVNCACLNPENSQASKCGL